MQVETAKELGFRNHYNGIKHDPKFLGALTTSALSGYIDGVVAADKVLYDAFILKTKEGAKT